MITTPEQQAAAAEAARKDSPPEEKKDEVKPAPQPMAGSPSKLQTPAATTTTAPSSASK
jgi:hypothetical protein